MAAWYLYWESIYCVCQSSWWKTLSASFVETSAKACIYCFIGKREGEKGKEKAKWLCICGSWIARTYSVIGTTSSAFALVNDLWWMMKWLWVKRYLWLERSFRWFLSASALPLPLPSGGGFGSKFQLATVVRTAEHMVAICSCIYVSIFLIF